MDIGLMHVTPCSKADPAKVAKRAEELGFELIGSATIPSFPSNRAFPIPVPNMMVGNRIMYRYYPTR
jgi:hypothetical protein